MFRRIMSFVNFRRGLELVRAGQNEAAIEQFNVTIRLNPKNAKAYWGRGTAKSELDLDSDAMADFDEAVRLSPYDFRAWALRGMEKARYGHYDLAIADYHEAIRLNPNHEEANLGLNYIKTHGIHDLVMAEILREDPSADAIFFPEGAQDYTAEGGCYCFTTSLQWQFWTLTRRFDWNQISQAST